MCIVFVIPYFMMLLRICIYIRVQKIPYHIRISFDSLGTRGSNFGCKKKEGRGEESHSTDPKPDPIASRSSLWSSVSLAHHAKIKAAVLVVPPPLHVTVT